MDKITIKGKEYELKMPSLGVLRLITEEMKDLIKVITKDLQKKGLKDVTKKLTLNFFNLFLEEKSEETVNKICKITALYINNKNPAEYTEEDLTAEDILWNVPMDTIFKIIEKLVG